MIITPNRKYIIREAIKKHSLEELDMKIVILMLEGNTYKQIGKKVHKSGRTVDGRTSELRKRFEANNNTHLVAILISRKIITIK